MAERKIGYRYPNGRLKWKKVRKHTPGTYVYVLIAVGQMACKVGVSSNIQARMDAISTTGLVDLQICWAGRMATRDVAFRVEKLAHLYLTEQGMHKRGEWFSCSGLYARDAVLRVIEKYGTKVDHQIGFVENLEPVENLRDRPRIPCNLGWSVA
jgi:hypothetical protein